MWSAVFIAVVIVAILVITALVQRDYLYGFWTTDDCADNDCESIMLFIGEPSGLFWVKRTCYLVIMDNICSQGLELSYRQPIIGLYSSGFSADAEFEDEAVWPSRVKFDVDMTDGSLCVSADGVVYARLHKAHEITNAAALQTSS